MNIQEQIDFLKNISYKEILFYIAEKGSLEDFKNIIDKIGKENLGKSLCQEIDSDKYNNKILKKAVNDNNYNILEVLITENRPLSLFTYLINILEDCNKQYKVKDYFRNYRDWYKTDNGNLLDLIIEKKNIDYYNYMINEGYFITNNNFLKSLLVEPKFFKIIKKDFSFNNAFNSYEYNGSNNIKSSFLDFIEKNKDNNNLVKNFSLLKKMNLFISELLITCIKEKKENIYFLFKDINIFSINLKNNENIFNLLETKDEELAYFLEKTEFNLIYKDKKGFNIIELMNNNGIQKEEFPITRTLIEKYILNNTLSGSLIDSQLKKKRI